MPRRLQQRHHGPSERHLRSGGERLDRALRERPRARARGDSRCAWCTAAARPPAAPAARRTRRAAHASRFASPAAASASIGSRAVAVAVAARFSASRPPASSSGVFVSLARAFLPRADFLPPAPDETAVGSSRRTASRMTPHSDMASPYSSQSASTAPAVRARDPPSRRTSATRDTRPRALASVAVRGGRRLLRRDFRRDALVLLSSSAASPASSAGTRAAAARTRVAVEEQRRHRLHLSRGATRGVQRRHVPMASTATDAPTSWSISAIRGWKRVERVHEREVLRARRVSARSAASTARRTRGSLSLRPPRYRRSSERKKSGCARIHAPMPACTAPARARPRRGTCVKICNASAIIRSAPRMRACVWRAPR